jgi:hypothetical protein
MVEVFGTTSAAGWTRGVPPVTAGGMTSLLLPPELLLPLEGSAAMTTPITAPATTTIAPAVIRLRRYLARRCCARIWVTFSRARCLFLAPFDISICPLASRRRGQRRRHPTSASTLA